MPEPIKIGLLVDGDSVPMWAAEIIKRINEGDYAQITLVVKNTLPGELDAIRDEASANGNTLRTLWLKFRRNLTRLFFIAFWYFDRNISRWKNHFESPFELSELVPGVKTIEVTPRKTKFSDVIDSDDIEKIAEADVDILFRLGFRILRGRILDVARYGIWSFHHGDNRYMRGGPSGYWELTHQAPTVGVILQILNEDLDGGAVLERSWHLPDILLLNRQRQNVFMQSLSHFPRHVERLHRMGPDAYFAEIKRKNRHPEFYSNPMRVAPRNSGAFRSLGQHYLRYLWKKLIQLFFFRQWMLLGSAHHGRPMSTSMWRFKDILPPRDRMWADPFIIEKDGTFYLYIEEMIYAKGHGHISMMTMDRDGNWTNPVPIIEMPYHMSYPFVFEYENQWYMIPETAENRTVDLYKCTQFPDKWEKTSTLMSDIFAVDSTLLEHEGKWWMFTTVKESEHTNCLDELHIYYADSPLSTEWTPHPRNPVSTDVRNARPAGAIFESGGSLYRPAQNGSNHYGYGMNINLIEVLDTENYKERTVSSIEPKWDWSINATHTLNHTDGLTMSDGSKLRFRYFRNHDSKE